MTGKDQVVNKKAIFDFVDAVFGARRRSASRGASPPRRAAALIAGDCDRSRASSGRPSGEPFHRKANQGEPRGEPATSLPWRSSASPPRDRRVGDPRRVSDPLDGRRRGVVSVVRPARGTGSGPFPGLLPDPPQPLQHARTFPKAQPSADAEPDPVDVEPPAGVKRTPGCRGRSPGRGESRVRRFSRQPLVQLGRR